MPDNRAASLRLKENWALDSLCSIFLMTEEGVRAATMRLLPQISAPVRKS
jgi:hypothetical protein